MVTTGLLFPGQGAQSVGMGRDLAEAFPVANAVFLEVDEALATPLSRIMWNGPDEELTLTHNAQPAILAHSLAAFAVIREAIAPVAAAGHSLGEYSAYAAAGALALADAARLVRQRGELMLQAGQARAGTMTAILGLDTDDVIRCCRDATSDAEVVVPANMNAPDQTVISGDPTAVERAGAACNDAGAKRVLPLKVSGAFHSPLMQPARDGLEAALDRAAFCIPEFPVVANATAEPVTTAEGAAGLLAEQLTSAVRWVECTGEVIALAGPNTLLLELGPGKVLAGLTRRIAPGAEVASLGTAGQVQAFLESHT